MNFVSIVLLISFIYFLYSFFNVFVTKRQKEVSTIDVSYYMLMIIISGIRAGINVWESFSYLLIAGTWILIVEHFTNKNKNRK